MAERTQFLAVAQFSWPFRGFFPYGVDFPVDSNRRQISSREIARRVVPTRYGVKRKWRGYLATSPTLNDALGQFDPKAQRMVAFFWRLARGMKRTAESEWIEEVPGIDLARCRCGDLATDTVQ